MATRGGVRTFSMKLEFQVLKTLSPPRVAMRLGAIHRVKLGLSEAIIGLVLASGRLWFKRNSRFP